MSSTRTFILIAAAASLSGCVQAPGHMDPNFGYAVGQDIAAQIADPDARYQRALNPASSGQRAVGAQDRYAKGQVLQPATEGTGAFSTNGSGGAPPAGGN